MILKHYIANEPSERTRVAEGTVCATARRWIHIRLREDLAAFIKRFLVEDHRGKNVSQHHRVIRRCGVELLFGNMFSIQSIKNLGIHPQPTKTSVSGGAVFVIVPH